MLDTLQFLLGLMLTMTKGAFQALAVIYPSYKTWKALESRSLRASQAMLLYWCITAFVSSVKEFADQVLGTYANFFLWKLTIVGLKAAPLIIGPDRMYNMLVKPLFEANEERVDAVVEEAHKIKAIAQEAVPAVKEGDIDAVKEKATEVVDTLKESDLVHSIQNKALSLTHTLQEKSAQLGFAWDAKSLTGLLENSTNTFESSRDTAIDYASNQWTQYQPTVAKHTNTIRNTTAQYAPVVKQKAVDLYSQNIAPKVQPVVATANEKYTSTVKPFVLKQRDAAIKLWVQYGGPIRQVWSTRVLPFWQQTAQPFVQNKLMPFLTDSFLPAVYETLIALKDSAMDLLSTPTEETRTTRLAHKRSRDEARKERIAKKNGKIYKRQKTDRPIEDIVDTVKSKAADLAGDVKNEATLINRKTKEMTDSSIDAPKQDISLPLMTQDDFGSKPISDLKPSTNMDIDSSINKDIDTQSHKLSHAGSEKRGEWASEPRADNLVAAE